VELNTKHTDNWTPCETKSQISDLEDNIPLGSLNIFAGLDKPKYIRYRQMPTDFEIQTKLGTFQGKGGDYLFVDPSGGQAIVPYEIFEKIF
jgi:hypothetical protein